jgi:hypothetical protein
LFQTLAPEIEIEKTDWRASSETSFFKRWHRKLKLKRLIAVLLRRQRFFKRWHRKLKLKRLIGVLLRDSVVSNAESD